MVNESQLVEVIKKAKESDKARKFQQSIELILVFKDIDVKKGFAINETIQLPKKMSKSASVCIIAAGDLGIKAKNAKADRVMNASTKLHNVYSKTGRSGKMVFVVWQTTFKNQDDVVVAFVNESFVRRKKSNQ